MSRNYKFDNIKVLLIFLVVFGHLLRKGTSNEAAELIYFYIYAMHMPVFIFISGYFSNYRKFKYGQFLRIYVIYQAIAILLNILLSSEPTVITSGSIRDWIVYPQWTLWYLLSFIELNFLLSVAERKKIVLYIIFVCTLVYGLFDIRWSFLSIGRTLGFFPYFYLGYRVRKMDFERVTNSLSAKYLLICLPIVLVGIYGLTFIVSVEFFYLSKSFAAFDINIILALVLRLFTYAIGVYWILFAMKFVSSQKTLLSSIGRRTLAIYLYHSIAILLLVSLVDVKVIPTNIYIVLCFALSFIGIIVLQYIPVLGYARKN